MPSIAGAVRSYLSGVSCDPGYLLCTAVGAYETGSDALLPLVETWNGSSWLVRSANTIQGAAESALSAVSCTVGRFCMAVGVFQSSADQYLLAEEQVHGIWVPVPGPTLRLQTNLLQVTGVSCASASLCTAVGDYLSSSGEEVTLAALWHTDGWLHEDTPTPGRGGVLRAVSCPAEHGCIAVGYYDDTTTALDTPQRTLAEQWNGRSWTVMDTADEGKGVNSLDAVSCAQAGACTAVGDDVENTGTQETLAEQLAGASWAIRPTPDLTGSQDNELNAVSCTAAGACAAAGDYQDSSSTSFTQALAWNGTAWNPQHNALDQAQLLAVSCSAPSACTAVGNWEDSLGDLFVLADRWNGVTWSAQLAPTALGSPSATLTGVSCPAVTSCVAVGSDYDTFTGDVQTWAEEWNGTGWTWQNPPDPGNEPSNFLDDVSCVSAARCIAVGYGFGTEAQDLVEVWQNGGWTAQTPASPSNDAGLTGVSCTSATVCTAVGTKLFFGEFGFADQLSGSTWSLENTNSPSNSQLLEISCTSSACTAVGLIAESSDSEATLAEQLTNGTWAVQSTESPGGYDDQLNSVSCTAASACTAVGADSPSAQTGDVTLAETWNASTWSVQPTVNEPGSFASGLNAVSCVATSCTAVGSYANAGQQAYPLAESQSQGSESHDP